tara:strand:+ start:17671 stop:18351 length:681 start_codon:yes stop_codon:yes gene_type:complete
MFKSKKLLGFSTVILSLSIFAALIFLIPNSLESYIISEAKAKGYIEYKPMEAHDLANKICTQCHTLERIKQYCPRCGPPFVAVVPHMQTFIENYKVSRPEVKVINITEPQAVAIVQVWNALIGNWESDFREQDILKLIGHYPLLAKLFKTPVEERKIEATLSGQEELKIGHMTGLPEMQKDLGKPENNPGPSQDQKEHKQQDDEEHMQHEEHKQHEKHKEHEEHKH